MANNNNLQTGANVNVIPTGMHFNKAQKQHHFVLSLLHQSKPLQPTTYNAIYAITNHVLLYSHNESKALFNTMKAKIHTNDGITPTKHYNYRLLVVN